jgi:hypothetical protein
VAFDDQGPEVELAGPGGVRPCSLPGREWPGEGQENKGEQAAHGGRSKAGVESITFNQRKAVGKSYVAARESRGGREFPPTDARSGGIPLRAGREVWQSRAMPSVSSAVFALGRQEAKCA